MITNGPEEAKVLRNINFAELNLFQTYLRSSLLNNKKKNILQTFHTSVSSVVILHESVNSTLVPNATFCGPCLPTHNHQNQLTTMGGRAESITDFQENNGLHPASICQYVPRAFLLSLLRSFFENVVIKIFCEPKNILLRTRFISLRVDLPRYFDRDLLLCVWVL